MDFSEFVDRDAGVDLGRGEILVTQERLDKSRIGAVLQHVGGAGVAQQVMARQELGFLERAIAGLPEGCRAVLLLRKVDLLSHREIADKLGIAVSTVEKQHARALRLLRAALPGDPDPTPETKANS